MNINLLLNKRDLAYARIKSIFAKTGKLKKVSYSIGRSRFCYYGTIENGILNVKLKISKQRNSSQNERN